MSGGVETPRMSKEHILLGEMLGDGGQGRVYAVQRLRINGSWPVVYKQYRQRTPVDGDVLKDMASLFSGIDYDRGQWLGEHMAWPAAVVEEQGRAVGFLMRAAPEEFYIEPSFAPGTKRPAGFEFLLNSTDYIRRVIGEEPTPRQLLLLLADLARLLAELHELGVVVGDLSPKNVLFSFDPHPHCFLMDCDSVQFRGRTVLPQVQTPSWEVPPGETVVSEAGDAYKFGLLAIRVFAREQSGGGPADLAAIDSRLGALARRSLDVRPANRPSLGEWRAALEAAATLQTAFRPSTGGAARGGPRRSPVRLHSSDTPVVGPAENGGTFGCVLLMAVVLVSLLVGLLVQAR
ncbi:hypothetical protein [Streptomyces sp. NPDC053367]|uniref:hypothetical protein n=1 Tax=Streptomyces sp. NPDC053367 TaxID=3365700 RepID=UPI0037D90733